MQSYDALYNMNFILEGISQAFNLIISFDKEVFRIVFFTLKISAIGILFSSICGIPIGFVLGIKHFRGKSVVLTLLNTLMAFPTVIVGLLVYSFISRQGPLGFFGLLYTPTAIVIGQFFLALPLISSLTVSAVQGLDPRVEATAITLGANRIQRSLTILNEARFAVISAILAGYGRIIAEVGSAMILGGNIKGYTRTMTTAIALEVSKGEFGYGLALGFILLTLALVINFLFHILQRRDL